MVGCDSLQVIVNQEGAGTATNGSSMPRVPTPVRRLLPVKPYQPPDSQNPLPGAPVDRDCCSICLVEFEEGENVTVLPCRHFYHNECIDSWLKRNCACPLCKANVLEALRPQYAAITLSARLAAAAASAMGRGADGRVLVELVPRSSVSSDPGSPRPRGLAGVAVVPPSRHQRLHVQDSNQHTEQQQQQYLQDQQPEVESRLQEDASGPSLPGSMADPTDGIGSGEGAVRMGGALPAHSELLSVSGSSSSPAQVETAPSSTAIAAAATGSSKQGLGRHHPSQLPPLPSKPPLATAYSNSSGAPACTGASTATSNVRTARGSEGSRAMRASGGGRGTTPRSGSTTAAASRAGSLAVPLDSAALAVLQHGTAEASVEDFAAAARAAQQALAEAAQTEGSSTAASARQASADALEGARQTAWTTDVRRVSRRILDFVVPQHGPAAAEGGPMLSNNSSTSVAQGDGGRSPSNATLSIAVGHGAGGSVADVRELQSPSYAALEAADEEEQAAVAPRIRSLVSIYAYAGQGSLGEGDQTSDAGGRAS